MDHSKSSSVKVYITVALGLLTLTATTVWVSTLHLPHLKAMIIAALIALTKCTLIASFFMHLRSEKKAIHAFLFVALFFVLVLALVILPDIGLIHYR